MMSVLARRFDDIKAGPHRAAVQVASRRHRRRRPAARFHLCRRRGAGDDVAVGDAIGVSGLFNVGTGKARSFRDLMLSAYAALGTQPNIDYIDMPEQIRGSYQYFTQSEVDRLQRAGYNGGFTALEDAVGTYVKGFLDRADRFR